MMATDLQGCKSGARGYQLTDPAMVCPSQLGRFGPTNFTAAQLEMCLEGVEHGLKAGKSLYPGMKLGSSYRPGFSRHDPEGLGFKAVVDARTARRRRERAAVATSRRPSFAWKASWICSGAVGKHSIHRSAGRVAR